jgi:hypothetical protein
VYRAFSIEEFVLFLCKKEKTYFSSLALKYQEVAQKIFQIFFKTEQYMIYFGQIWLGEL